jgi:hypothetical protein
MKNEEFSCMRDDLTIRGHIFGKGTAPKPAVILSHGFMANEKTCYDYAKLIESLGYVAFTYDFCGGGLGVHSDGKTEDMTVLTEKKDLHSVIDYVSSLPFVDSERISLLGCSQGGFVSAMVAKEIPEKIASLILIYPALCIPDDARSGKMMFFKFDPKNIPDILGRLPMKLGGDYARCVIDMDPYEEIGGFEKPVLYLHGTDDNIVNISYARKANVLYPQCSYFEIIGGGHGFKGEAEKEAQQHISDFLKNQLK